MKKLLFVDDDEQALNALKRVLRPLYNEWNMHFVSSASEALNILEKNPFDVIISEMRMPVMNGADLLAEVRNKYPHMIRIILSGYSDEDTLLKAVQTAHQFLSKPISADELRNSIKRISKIHDLLHGEKVKSVITQIDSLPSLPRLYGEILDKLKDDDTSIAEIGKIIEQDIGMTSQILKLVNSSFFGLYKHITSPVEATMLLGLEMIKTLVLSIEIFSVLNVGDQIRLSMNELWERSTLNSLCAKKIAAEISDDRLFIDDAFCAGLLADIGILLLASQLPEEYKKVLNLQKEQNILLSQAEEQVFGSSHAQIGAYLLGVWGLPQTIVEAVAEHHNPEIFGDEPHSLITVLHISDVFTDRLRQKEPDILISQLDEKYITDLQLSVQIEKWFERCEQVYASGEKNE